MSQLRLFVALDLPAEIKAVVAQVQTRLRVAEPSNVVRWVDASGAHITLKYLGVTSQVAQIKAELDRLAPQQQPFALHTTQPGAFPHTRQPRILWLGVGGALPALSGLQRLVETHLAPLGFPMEPRAFSPHITLGRVKQGDQPQSPAVHFDLGSYRPFLEWRAAELVLMLSETGPQGARYTPIHAVQFDAR
ncbi:MAG: RNA 2',3'-cyclic phosphodiesterase [Herpetosiphonaceae bacterium]|nr:RNA 2',3'-cyclic phosphodiesterase [Herpetosiphonaceae bacterium]